MYSYRRNRARLARAGMGTRTASGLLVYSAPMNATTVTSTQGAQKEELEGQAAERERETPRAGCMPRRVLDRPRQPSAQAHVSGSVPISGSSSSSRPMKEKRTARARLYSVVNEMPIT